MAFVVLSIIKPKAVIRGVLRNVFLEVQSCLFVGSLDTKRLKELVGIIEVSRSNAVLCVSSPKSATGFRVKVFGKAARTISEIDGVQLVFKNIQVDQ